MRITVRKTEVTVGKGKMWKGSCTCGKTWQFWFFGATLGYGLEHMRREVARG